MDVLNIISTLKENLQVFLFLRNKSCPFFSYDANSSKYWLWSVILRWLENILLR